MFSCFPEEEEEADADTHFYTRLVADRWTVAHLGHDSTDSICFARSHTVTWCELYRWPKQKGFGLAAYGDRNAVMLSKEWARRGCFFMQMWLDAGSPRDFAYSTADAAGYAESMAFLEWACGVDADSDVMTRIVEMRAFRPHLLDAGPGDERDAV